VAKRTAPSNSASSPHVFPCISWTLLIYEGAICPPHPHCWLYLLEFGKPKRGENQRFTPKSTLPLAGAKACSYSTSRHFVPSAAHARCHVFSPRLQNFPPFIPLSSPFPSCACSPFRPVSSFHPVSSNIYRGSKRLC
jgi:hypothetical protein